MYNDYFLKADSEDALNAALLDAGIYAEGEEGFTLAAPVALDVIGIIYQPTGDMQEVDGMEMPVMAPIDGYHANLRGNLTAEQVAKLPIIDAPSTPSRVWA